MDCIFCKIVKGDIPSQKVYEDEFVYAFRDIEPQAPIHVIVIPKEHYRNILEIPQNSELTARITDAIKRIAKREGICESGFRIVNNCGEQGGQTVEHLHYHVLGGRNLTWPPG